VRVRTPGRSDLTEGVLQDVPRQRRADRSGVAAPFDTALGGDGTALPRLSGASFSRDRRYRYRLWRRWDAARPVVAFVMLNPSTADAARDDPTIRRWSGFARAWGYGRLEVVNLFAYRATDPRWVRHVPGPVGPADLRHLAAGRPRARVVTPLW